MPFRKGIDDGTEDTEGQGFRHGATDGVENDDTEGNRKLLGRGRKGPGASDGVERDDTEGNIRPGPAPTLP